MARLSQERLQQPRSQQHPHRQPDCFRVSPTKYSVRHKDRRRLRLELHRPRLRLESSTGPHQRRHHLHHLRLQERATDQVSSCLTSMTTNRRLPACHHRFRLRLRYCQPPMPPQIALRRFHRWTVLQRLLMDSQISFPTCST